MHEVGARRLSPLCGLTFLAFVTLLTVVSARHGAPVGPDLALHHWVMRHRSPGLTGVARALSDSTAVTAYVLAAAGAVTAGRRVGARALWVPAAVACLAAGQFVRLLLVHAVGRARPPVRDWVAAAGGPAFPSGHTTTSALGAGICCLALLSGRGDRSGIGWRRTAAAVALCWAVAIGCTRVYLGVHWPTDVLAGWLLAATLLLAAAQAARRRRGRRSAGRQGEQEGRLRSVRGHNDVAVRGPGEPA